MRKHELGPGDRQQQQDRRPYPECFGIGQPQPEAAAGDRSTKPIGPIEQRPPRIDERPKIAGERREYGKPDPKNDPDQRRCEVLIRVLTADESREYDQYQQGDGDQPENERDRRMRDPSPGRIRAHIQPRITLRAGRVAGEQPDDDERQNDGGRRAEQIERERQGQVVALAEAMGLRRGCEQATGREDEGESECLSVYSGQLPRLQGRACPGLDPGSPRELRA